MQENNMPDLSVLLNLLMSNPDMARGLLSMIAQGGGILSGKPEASCKEPEEEVFPKNEKADRHCKELCQEPDQSIRGAHASPSCDNRRYSNGFCDFTGVNHYERRRNEDRHESCDCDCKRNRYEKDDDCMKKKEEKKAPDCYSKISLEPPCDYEPPFQIPEKTERACKEHRENHHASPGKKERDALIAAIRPFLSGERQEKMGQILQMADVLAKFRKRGEY